MKGKSFTWNDRLTLINHYKPSDTQACGVFGITKSELDVARNQLRAGVFSLSPTLDVESYGNLFDSSESTTVTTTQAPVRTKPTVTSTAQRETASAKVREPKKRGRKGDKIALAFSSIPASPTAAQDFAKEHGVSIAVLRQSKRFDGVGVGVVKVKKDKTSKALMIWRELV